MAFNASGTDYGGFQRSRDRADEGLTRAQDSAGRAAKQARIKKSGERSGLQKLVSAGVRGAAAYYSGGLSEQMGAGGMIDSAMLGTDSQGNAVQNEYGDLVGAGSAVYQGSKAIKAGKLGEQDAKFDKLMDRREKNVKMLFEGGDKKGAMKAQSAMEDMRLKYDTNRKDAEGKGWGGSGLGMSDEDYNLQPTAMTPGQREANVARLNRGEDQTAQAIIKDEGRRQQGQRGLPPKADAPRAPDPSSIQTQERPAYETQLSKPDVKSAALQSTAPSSQYQLQGEERKREQDDLIERITGDKAPSNQDIQQKRALNSWTSNMTDADDPNVRISENWKKKQLTNRGAQ
jgi:hypothetical protein